MNKKKEYIDERIKYIKNLIKGTNKELTYNMFQTYLDKYYTDDEQIKIEHIIAFHEHSYLDNNYDHNDNDIKIYQKIIKNDHKLINQILAKIGFDLIKINILDKYKNPQNINYNIIFYDNNYKQITDYLSN